MASRSRRSRRTPRYRQLAETLTEQIRSGRVGVGERLPGEIELTQHYGVSRHTVREALRVLAELGLIGRRPGVGTVVRSVDAMPGHVQRVASSTGLLRHPAHTRMQVHACEVLTISDGLSHTLGCPAGERRVRISGLRRDLDDATPVCWSEVFVLPDHARVATMIGRDSRPVHRLIEECFGVKSVDVEVQLSAGLVTARLSPLLAVPERSAVLRVVRRHRSADGQMFQVSLSEYPAERFAYTLRLTRGWEPAPVDD